MNTLVCLVLLSITSLAVASFVHPGVVVNKAQLDYMVSQITLRTDNVTYPAYLNLIHPPGSRATAQVYPVKGPPQGGLIQCGVKNKPDIGCNQSSSDATTAYGQALMWYITKNQTHADNGIRVLNSYAYNLTGFRLANSALQCAWITQMLTKAAEILYHTGGGWPTADFNRFIAMLYKVVLPLIYKGSTEQGNWELAMIDAMIGIAVLSDNQTLFNHSLDLWHARLPMYIYNFELDGNTSAPVRGGQGWWDQPVFNASTSGVCQETCRDVPHVQMGISSMINVAETAFIQGVDLYSPNQRRITPALELHSRIMLYGWNNFTKGLFCGSHPKTDTIATFDRAYNAYHNRLGVPLPFTNEHLIKQVRVGKIGLYASNGETTAFEALTHGGSPQSLIPTLSPTPPPTPSPTGHGLSGAYFSDNNLTVLVAHRTDPNINFDYGQGKPAGIPGIQDENWSIRWTGYILPNCNGSYIFTTVSGGAVRLWVKGSLVVDNWSSHATIIDSGTVALTAGKQYSIKLEYKKDATIVNAQVTLSWQQASSSSTSCEPFAIVPQASLLPF